MILATTVQQITSYEPVAHRLEEKLRSLQVDLGYKVIKVIETTIHNEQGFIILFEVPDEKDNNTGKVIADKFKEFIHSQNYDPYEVAVLCGQVLSENNVDCCGSKRNIGIKLFDDKEE